ncbi:MAG TPA: orotidine 5'-phosphate decarboxylase / HUMPS family protein [Candidatus Andersenbacteria bacterium]|nr:orotidine 5'-phosphate decarboxylase / HUMPS family protein [Candidatus Andersenbacteria bacterium]
MSKNPADYLVPALDMDFSQIGPFMEQVLPLGVTVFKVGLKTIHKIGTPAARQLITKYGGRPFVDAKLSDTPDTMNSAAAAIVADGDVAAFNVHASCGIKSMRAAVSAKGSALILAVSVLTSLSEEETSLIFGAPARAKVLQFARDAVLAGVDGMICSPLELPLFSEHEELSSLEKWNPGIRPAYAAAGQQKRFTTPAEAISLGATRIIIGSPLYKHPSQFANPAEATKAVLDEIESAIS